MQHVIREILRMFSIIMVRYFSIAGLAFLVFYWLLADRYKKAKIQARHADRKDFFREIRHSILSGLILAATAFLVVSGPLRPYTLIYARFSDYPVWWMPISLVLTLVVHDTYFYWMHRGLHHDRIFRYTHLVHHESTNPSPWTSYSFHFLEAILEAAVVIVLAFVMPLHPLTILLFTFVSFFINVYGHLGYEIMPRSLRHSIWFEIINTSLYHNLHHRKFKGNYSLYFRFWDRVMGTEHPDYVKEYDRIQQQRFGSNPR
jgi:lathosterol oxidase